MTGERLRFDGWIAGVGTSSGVRLVVGHWPRSPFGAFSDVMVEHPDGERVLLAPDRRIADFVAATYRFDRVEVVPVAVAVAGDTWAVEAGALRLRLRAGRRPLSVCCCPPCRPHWSAARCGPRSAMCRPGC